MFLPFAVSLSGTCPFHPGAFDRSRIFLPSLLTPANREEVVQGAGWRGIPFDPFSRLINGRLGHRF
eukprot:13069778-Heterocapsa_arctica.AAC.1